MEEVINEGDKGKQGNMTCPNCGRTVLIPPHWGDPPTCPKCGTPYRPILKPPIFND